MPRHEFGRDQLIQLRRRDVARAVQLKAHEAVEVAEIDRPVTVWAAAV